MGVERRERGRDVFFLREQKSESERVSDDERRRPKSKARGGPSLTQKKHFKKSNQTKVHTSDLKLAEVVDSDTDMKEKGGEKEKKESEFWHEYYDYIVKRSNDLGETTLRKYV